MTILDRSALQLLIPGMTHVLDRNGEEAYVYFEAGDVAHMLLEDGETRTGVWKLTDHGYVVEWNTGAVGRWALDHEEGAITYVNLDRGIRVKLRGILFGNAKGLPRAAL